MLDNAIRWRTVLAQLEEQVQCALLQTTTSDDGARVPAWWQPPSDLGPVPEELRERALQLAVAQQHAMDRVKSAMRSSRRQSAFVASVPRPGNGVRSAYLDTES
ncbi:hypothetical protein [Arthrobacter roseus]|uniref:hypothetical protein n=1 Tax=Arthrobacter roseus TaxID=136274 RepID=UPI0019635939|nr:hypothetical protein [Arthrobacter roseus]MBM7847655.1 hypothetical protein [Arthrobacter roseus]